MPSPAGLSYPFLAPAFHRALEDTGAVGAGTGWSPVHLTDEDFWMPLYLKYHSRGEYVFDFAWAEAWLRNGLDYYPKLVTAIPFTPVPGPRWRGEPPAAETLRAWMIERVQQLGASGWHLLFPDEPTRAALEGGDLIRREACHFRWFNRGYADFDDFLGTLVSRKRKSLRRERRRVGEQGLTVARRTGPEIDPHWWSAFERFYADTYFKHGQRPYLPPSFFRRIAVDMPEQLMMAMAFLDGEPAAAALYFFDEERLYGRYWGCLREYDALHFELCYYQGIEFAIERGLTEFDPGVQGEHKILRGFEPVITTSLHYIDDARFREAVADFCRRESGAVRAYQEEARTVLPYRSST